MPHPLFGKGREGEIPLSLTPSRWGREDNKSVGEGLVPSLFPGSPQEAPLRAPSGQGREYHEEF